jgi:lipopolysaccharide transport system ATP-binding protein
MKSISIQKVSKEFALSAGPGGKPARRLMALEDVSFDAEQGDVIGIIGRNGAGKSTLLKIISRILRPTRGRIELNGRVGSLLEVGTGFHPDLTGRENIFLNAAILGMHQSEILKKLDAIIAFAGFEDHLDEPVKHYSSGMYMRLAFAVAAHVEPEILLIDEVLAVGDADFQRKCIERIEQVGEQGQTVLFVSHSIHTVLRLCRRAVLLEKGRVVACGTARDVAALYLESGARDGAESRYRDRAEAPGDGVARLRAVRVRSAEGETLATLDIGSPFGVEMEFEVLTPGMVLFPSIVIHNEWGPICFSTDVDTVWHGKPGPVGHYRAVAWFPGNFLSAGKFTATASVHSFSPHMAHFNEPEAVRFQVLETAGGSRGNFTGYIDGSIRPWLHWDVEHGPLTNW